MKTYKEFLEEKREAVESGFIIDERKVNQNQAATKMQKLIDMIDKVADMVVDMQDQDLVSSKDVKKFEKGASDVRSSLGNMK